MKRKQLQTLPYNKYFINCVANNLLGILLSSNPNLGTLPWSVPFVYKLFQPARGNTYEEVDPVLLKQGKFVLQLKPHSQLIQRKLENWFYVREEPLVTSNLHTIIQSLLDEDYYVFVDVDRFYMKGGIDYLTRSSIHPTFIYGYDEMEKNYMLMEDCVRSGTFAPYIIDFNDFEAAYLSARDKSIPLLRVYKRKKSAEEWSWTMVEWFRCLTPYLEETANDSNRKGPVASQLTVKTGLSCIQAYSESIHVVIPAISTIEADLLNSVTLPFQFHARTEEIIKHFINEENQSDLLSYLEPVRMLKREWGTYRNLMLKYIFNKEQNQEYELKLEVLDKYSSLLLKIYNMEKKCYNGIIGCLSHDLRRRSKYR